jgi:arsenite methyltransferase
VIRRFIMTDQPSCAYERPALREALGDILRPGGLALTDEALAGCGLPPAARVLDVGCGAGATVAHLRGRYDLAAVGIDASAVLLASGRSRVPALPLALARGERLPIGDGMLDAVLAECSLSVMADVDAALAEFRRVLKPKGRLFLADLYARTLDGPPRPRARQPSSCLRGALSRTQIEGKLAVQGFDLAIWQDRSATVKVLAARLILAGVSPGQFWGGACGDAAGAIASLKPGYFWLIASKGAGD